MNTKQESLLVAPIEKRVEAIEHVLKNHGLDTESFIDNFHDLAFEQWIPNNGARLVARAWVDPEFKEFLLKDGVGAAKSMGFSFPPHHRYLVALENTDDVQNVICCTLCSCTAFSIIGLPPDWYKDLEYRARVVREARTVLKEMGLELPTHVQIKVWDTTADTRYMVIPQKPKGVEGWSESKLADLITKESMIGVANL
jgi:nitrile hydratase